MGEGLPVALFQRVEVTDDATEEFEGEGFAHGEV